MLSILGCEKGPRPKAEVFFTAKNGEVPKVLTDLKQTKP